MTCRPNRKPQMQKNAHYARSPIESGLAGDGHETGAAWECQVRRNSVGDAFRCMAIPQRNGQRRLDLAVENPPDFLPQAVKVTPHENVSTVSYRDRPFGVIANREARDTEKRGFLLNATRVGNHEHRVTLQM